MGFDRAALIATFKAEASEYVAQLSHGLLGLEKNPGQSPLLQSLFRAAHTLKGNARLMGCPDMQRLAHRLEDILSEIRDGKRACDSRLVTAMLKTVDGISVLVQALGALSQPPVDVEGLIRQLGQESPQSAGAPLTTASEIALLSPQQDKPAERTVVQPATAPLEEYIRVPGSRVGVLMNLTGELVVSKTRLPHKIKTLRQLSRAGKHLHKQFELLSEGRRTRSEDATPAPMPPSQQLHHCAAQLDALWQNLAALADRFSAEATSIDPIIEELQSQVKKLRMLSCAAIFEAAERVIRDIALEEHKEVRLRIEGSETEVDKHVLEVMQPCVMHLLRNAVSHAIELPAERRAQGKPQTGTIFLRAWQEAGQFYIAVQDDGRGIDLEKVKQTALKQALLAPETLARMSEGEQMDLIFAPGLSTRALVTDVSGRGVGLDVVRTEVTRLKGQVHLSSKPGQGATFTLALPLTIGILQVLIVETRGQHFGVPIASIEEVLAVQQEAIQTVGGSPAMLVRDRIVPLIFLADLLGLQQDTGLAANAQPHALMTMAQGRRIGLLVDRVMGEEKVFIKDFGQHLGKLPGASGAAVLETGELLVILETAELIAQARNAPPAHMPAAKESPAPGRILVVEDSVTTRELERHMLMARGYRVQTAVDGVDALDKLKHETFDLIVCDVQMPRMDGFEFCRQLRQMPALRELPLVFVTGLQSEEEKRRGMDAGAQAYIVKADFDQAELLKTIERLIGSHGSVS